MIKKLLVISLMAVAFAVGYGQAADALFGRSNGQGHFLGAVDTSGDYVFRPYHSPTPDWNCAGDGTYALPYWIDTKQEFINFIRCKLNSNAGSVHVRRQDRTGAAFIVQTMRGTTACEGGSGNNCRPSDASWNDWVAKINNPAVSVNWDACVSWSVNSLYQGNPVVSNSSPNDDAFYNSNGSSCQAIVFSYPGGSYVIRRFCANPVLWGDPPPLPNPINFNMSGSTTVNDDTVNPGQTITFTHTLTNGGPTATGSTNINWTTQKASSSGGSWSTVSSGNAGTFTNGQIKTPSGSTETFPVPNNATPGTQYCRRITWTPDTHSGGSQSSTPRCATVQYNFNLEPRITMTLTGSGSVVSEMVEAGDSVTITYSVNNTGMTVSQNVTCTYRQVTHVGYKTDPPPASATFTPSGSCVPSRTFPSNTNPSSTPPTQAATETIDTASLANRSICRSFTITPTGPSGGTQTATACFHVASKPYFRVFSGDIMAGGGFANADGSCSLNNRAAIIGWNKGSSGSYAGAGVQYAALAMHQIFEVASSRTSGGAPPAGHSFANNNNTYNNPGNGRYGGHFGGVQCIPNHFGDGPPEPYTNIATSSISGVLSGNYLRNGNLRIDGATIAAGTEATVYVDGNVFISNNITYGGNGSWSVDSIPTFQLIVKGSIFIENDVTQLDGLYVAQPDTDDTLSGRIYTCQTAASPYTPLSLGGQLSSQCSTKLTVNGAFVADQVWLMRTNGTLRQATSSDGPGTSHISEVFNLNPAFWISQPVGGSGSRGGQYDSISSLPPIL